MRKMMKAIGIIGMLLICCQLALSESVTPCIDLDKDLICDFEDDCIDVDGDGYGEGVGCLGVDCLDSDPNTPKHDTNCDAIPDRETNACGCENGTTIIVSQDTPYGCRDKRINCVGGVVLEPGYHCGSCYERNCTGPCDDGDPCTINDTFDDDCNCIGKTDTSDSDRDGVANSCDTCEGFDDNRDFDNDGIPDGCDEDPSCTDCTPDDEGMITFCRITPNGKALSYRASCEYIEGFFDENGALNDERSYCGPCRCDDLGKTDKDGDGICDESDECPDNPNMSKKDPNCGCVEMDTDQDGVCDSEDGCPENALFQAMPDCGCEDDEQKCNEAAECLIGEACRIGNKPGYYAVDENNDCYCDRCKDSDRDGVCDEEDVCPGYSDSRDADRDGIPDDCDFDDCGCERSVSRVYVCQIRNGRKITKKVWCTDLYQTTYEQFCGPCSCADINDKDSDGDGVCDQFDKCEGYNDANDRDGDGIPNLCDEDYPLCPDGCEITEDNKLIICHHLSRNHAIQIKANCDYLDKYFVDITLGIFKNPKDHCGPCECADFGKKDKDGDGICSDKDCDDNDPTVQEDCNQSDLTVNPNPVMESQSISVSTNAMSHLNSKVLIMGIDGKIYKEIVLQNGKFDIDDNNLSSGIYILRAENKGTVAVGKLIILK